MFDAEDPGTILDEFLIAMFLPAIGLFVTLWMLFRLVFDDALRAAGLQPIVPAQGAGAVSAGYGRSPVDRAHGGVAAALRRGVSPPAPRPASCSGARLMVEPAGPL